MKIQILKVETEISQRWYGFHFISSGRP